MENAKIIKEVYEMLKNRELHPSGTFDDAGRFWAENDDLLNVRAPSRAWPYSHMAACRTLKYVKAVAAKYNVETRAELMARV